MTRLFSPRAFKRDKNRLLIFLPPDQWADDVPLPPESRISYFGEYHEIPFLPMWEFVLEEDKTREILVGDFIVPMAFESAILWFQEKMNERGWEAGPQEGYRMEERALLRFQHPDTHAQVEINVQWWPYRHQCTAMIRREVIHPYEKIEIDVEKLIAETPDTPELVIAETET